MGAGDHSLKAFWNPGQPRHGLPASAYTEDRFWKRECETVLFENWVCAGFAHEIPDPGMFNRSRSPVIHC